MPIFDGVACECLTINSKVMNTIGKMLRLRRKTAAPAGRRDLLFVQTVQKVLAGLIKLGSDRA
jgi:hypothetical protein